jgi:hypothetical protein
MKVSWHSLAARSLGLKASAGWQRNVPTHTGLCSVTVLSYHGSDVVAWERLYCHVPFHYVPSGCTYSRKTQMNTPGWCCHWLQQTGGHRCWNDSLGSHGWRTHDTCVCRLKSGPRTVTCQRSRLQRTGLCRGKHLGSIVSADLWLLERVVHAVSTLVLCVCFRRNCTCGVDGYRE